MTFEVSLVKLIPKHIRRVHLIWSVSIRHMKSGNWAEILYVQKKFLWKFLNLLLSPLGLLLVLVMRAIRPRFLIRINVLTKFG